MEIVKGVVIELRPRLRCCNIFLTTAHLLSQDHFTITIRPDCIIFNYSQYTQPTNTKPLGRKWSTSSCESLSESEDESFNYSKFMNIKQFCKLVPGSVTNLKIENNSVSFRVLTEPTGPNCSGDFHSEIVNGNVLLDDNHVEKNLCILNLEKNIPVTIHCSNCLNEISVNTVQDKTGLTFNRVLELPSECMDMSEWFCHAPGKQCGHQAKKESNKNSNYSQFEPSEMDVFYGVSYFLMNSSIMSENIIKFNAKRNLVYCNRCLSCLGAKSANNNVLKFWNANIKFVRAPGESEDKTFNIFTYKQKDEGNADLVLQDAINVVKHSIKDSSIGFQIPATCKIILEVEEQKKQYLFLWILDRHLDLVKSATHVPSNSETKEMKLASVKAAKVLYMASDDTCILDSDEWNTSNVQLVKVSKKMLVALLSYLVDNSKSIPESFRKTSQYFVSYIYL